ncbi:MAG: hypothetical protein H0W74_14280 [Sphingosinicella sp.]|nr:hypothetical protein [Sphingosinicella sp.]
MTCGSTPNVWLDFLARYAEDPTLFVREVLGGDPYPDQMELLEAYGRRERRIAKRTGHGVGKTTTDAWILVHHAVCRFPQKSVCTAPTSKQLFDALYAETVTWFRRLPRAIQDLFEIKSESIELREASTESFISFRTSSPEKPEALAGVHSEWVLLIADEASGIPEAIYEAAVGSMSGHNACTILTGNPVRTSGLFFDVFNKPEMAASWVRLHTTCEGHPNVTPDFMEQVKNTYGEGSNAYRVRVLGEFPLSEANALIPFDLVESAKGRDVKPLPVRPIWGVDVGLSHDASAIAKRQGNVLLEPTEEFKADEDPMRVVAWVKAHWDRTLPSDRPQDINIDSIGMGVGVTWRLMELGLPARTVNVSESAAMNEQFMRLRDELGWKAREWFQKRDCNLCGDDKLAEELVRPTYQPTALGKVKVEGKRETMKRTKKPSPNRGDAFWYTFASEAVTASGQPAEPMSRKEPLKRVILGIV